MIKLFLQKEIRDILGSKKFAYSFGVCSLLIVLTFYVGAKNYRLYKARYEAAQAENLRKMEGLTDWLRVTDHRIFMPPQPLEALVNGISNDIGRTVRVYGRGELTAIDSRFNDDPVFAVFRFLDLNFIFLIVISLFAMLFTFDAVCGEKERGTLRLSFSNAIEKDKYIIGKTAGLFLALGTPLLVSFFVGILILPLSGIQLSTEEWVRLVIVIVLGYLYFGVFISLSVFISVFNNKSTHSFLILLAIWILSVFILPRSAVLLAGRAVDVPSVDELAYQKGRFRTQLFNEDRSKMEKFKPSKTGDMEGMANEFQKFMEKLSDQREEKIQQYEKRLNEERRNKQAIQQKYAFGLSKISPGAVLSLSMANVAGTSIELKQHF
ncbi:ABC transporter permease, partial [candidate division KSB1 bacterium]|nr:ABC transporter permease [candidate division KSB1 bacterium]